MIKNVVYNMKKLRKVDCKFEASLDDTGSLKLTWTIVPVLISRHTSKLKKTHKTKYQLNKNVFYNHFTY